MVHSRGGTLVQCSTISRLYWRLFVGNISVSEADCMGIACARST
ncbi:hypothetical protein [Coleofasciculus sp. FACHB-1120]|nr:hypothetical protein [Coleofasciculus sp. FACHB-1120]